MNFKTKFKENKGITLIALVVTIIVLLILAGISINALAGQNGILKRTTKAAAETEIAEIENQANLINIEKSMSSTETSMAEIVNELKERGYEIEQVIPSENDISGITLDSDSISISKNGSATITVLFTGISDGMQYYAVVNGEKYLMSQDNDEIKISREASKVDSGSEMARKLSAVISSGSSITLGTISENKININAGDTLGSSTITVTYGKYSKTCEASVIIRPAKDAEPDSNTTFSTAYGKIDVIWLSTSNKVISNPNAPALTSNGESLTPVKYNTTSTEWDTTTSSDSSWYNYTNNQWANARTKNNSYFVWIPRFAYRITYYSSETDTEPTGYYDGYGMWKATDGTKRCNLDEGIETVEYKGNLYIVHPAFETNLDNGGWDQELSGFWFAKFEMGGSATSLDSTYGTTSLRGQNIGTQYTTARKATYGYTGTEVTENGTTFNSFMNSHMIKNSEWGAVAYLTHSSFGRSGKEINPSSEFYRGGEKDKAYITNVAQSTTGNVYGIYDMSGGAYEFVAAFNNTGTLGSWTTETGLTADSASTKYATKYNNETSTHSANAVIYAYGKVGDATKEVNTGGVTKVFYSVLKTILK